MLDLFLQFVYQHPVIATISLVTCPLLSLAIFGLMDVAKLELWED